MRSGRQPNEVDARRERSCRRCPARPAIGVGERGVEAMLMGLNKTFGWAPVMEAGKIIGLKQPDEEGGGTVSLEP